MSGCGASVNVTIVGKCTHRNATDIEKLQPTTPNRRFLSADEREKAAKTLRKTLHTPTSLYAKRLANLDETECQAGNTTTCQTPSVLKQAAYEYDVKKRLHENIVVELELVRDSWQVSMPGNQGVSGYIQGLGVYPFYAIMYTEHQVKAYVDICRHNRNSVIHFDSTGSVISDVKGQKKPYYYCMYNAESKVPAFEFITTKHNATWISSMIEMFSDDAKLLNGRRPIRPKFVVTDFSYALIYATLHAFNRMTLVEYLKFAYDVMTRHNNTSSIQRRTFINLCTAHFSKTLSKRICRIEPRRRIRRAAMVMFTLLMRTTTLHSASAVYKKIYVLLCTQHDSKLVNNCFVRLMSYMRRGLPDKREIADMVDTVEDEDTSHRSAFQQDDGKMHESNATIKQQSPFTDYFQRVIDDVQCTSDNTDGDANNLYSPKLFAVIADVIHLYPLWAAALHGHVERFADDADESETEPPTCRSNAVIESHFKSVKHGKKERRKLRPRLFVKERLQAILARIKETTVAFPAKRKRKGTSLNDPSSATTVWCRRKKTRRYANKNVALEAFTDVQKSKNKRKRKSKRHTKKLEKSKTETSLSISSEITFKTNVINPLDDYEVIEEPVPIGRSTPVVTDIVPAEFDDNCIQMVHDLLKVCHPNIAGLEFVGLGLFRDKTMPKFTTADGTRFVQIINDGDHWMCVTNLFGSSTYNIYVYDSLQRKKLSRNAVTQISAILRNDDESTRLTIHIRKFARQQARSRACGLFAVAAAFACCNGVDPSGLDFDVDSMRQEVSNRLLERSPENIQGRQRWDAFDISLYNTEKAYCTCHRKRSGRMIQCTQCDHWFHVDCLDDIPSQVLHETKEPWSGPCCEVNVLGEETIATSESVCNN